MNEYKKNWKTFCGDKQMKKEHFSSQNKLFTPTLKKLILPKNKRILD